MLLKRIPKQGKIRVVLLNVVDKRANKQDQKEYLSELVRLVETAGGIEVVEIFQRRGTIDPKTYIGKGKWQDALQYVTEHNIDLIITNGQLKAKQVTYLQKESKLHVWDKVDVILKIFERHAKTREAKLQIELAKLQYQIPKIYTYQSTTLFERSGGGIGSKGMGEKGIEAEKRHLRKMIKQVEEKLGKMRKTRANQRKKRRKVPFPMVAIVGYTNAGKSTFLNTLTNKDVYIADELFATLDTRISRFWSQNLNQQILFADTIGFIRDLPTLLIESFKATLDEACEADLILHVFDGSDPSWRKKVQITTDILEQIGCSDVPTLLVANKSDLGCPVYAEQELYRVSSLDKSSLWDLFSMIEKRMEKFKVETI